MAHKSLFDGAIRTIKQWPAVASISEVLQAIFITKRLVGLVLASIAPLASAVSFAVSPVRFEMAPNERATSATITNAGDEALVMQADIFEWRQTPDGVDELIPTEDMILSPPIIKLEAKTRQVVRLVQLNPRPSSEQRYYRMFVREILGAITQDTGTQVRLATTFSLPIVVTPKGLKSRLGCKVERSGLTELKAVCDNQGSAFVLFGEMLLKNEANESIAIHDSLGYVLPGVRRSFNLKSVQDKRSVGKSSLEVNLGNGTVERFAIDLAD